MTTMMTRCLVVALLVFGVVSVAEADALDYKSSYAGTVLDTSFDIVPDGFYTDVVRGSGQGTFGQSDSVVVTEFVPVGFTGECASQDDLRLIVLYSKAVSTYAKGEQLYLSSGTGYLCLDLATGDYEGQADGVFDGGTGRFANASGTWHTLFSGRNLTVAAGLPFGFGSINGVTTGTLYLE